MMKNLKKKDQIIIKIHKTLLQESFKKMNQFKKNANQLPNQKKLQLADYAGTANLMSTIHCSKYANAEEV